MDRRPVRVAVDPVARQDSAEVAYVFRTLLATAGYPWIIEYASDNDAPVDVAYGDAAWHRASIRIPASGWHFASAPSREPAETVPAHGIPLLRFQGETIRPVASDRETLEFPTDLVFAAFWWLTGAREPQYPRSRSDDLILDDTLVRRAGLLSRPCVSLAAAVIRRHLESQGRPAARPAWSSGGKQLAFSFTHDVDYPEIIRPIEIARVLARRGPAGLRLARDVASGRSHFWKFPDWVELARELGTRPAFYFMARQGSLAEYALGTPDAFYDVGSPRFARLFEELRAQSCEIGLHASFHAHRSTARLLQERQRIETVAAVSGIGNRHHYWHLDPTDPNATLVRHEAAGLVYDSSLGLEYYPGFRRAICHPFRVFDARERRPIDVLQLPPAWMDDHFGRRRERNGIRDPDAAARELLDAARACGGTVIVDYHARGMNADFYPEYGPWLSRFVRENLGSDVAFMTPLEIVEAWRRHEKTLADASEDRLSDEATAVAAAPVHVEIRSCREADIPGVAALHSDLFGDPKQHGHSVGTLGPELLADLFYRLNLDNDSFHCDVATLDEKVIGFSVYSTDRSRVFRHPLVSHPIRLATVCARAVIRRPTVLRAFIGNLAYLGGESLPELAGVRGWWIVAGVVPEYRTTRFEKRAGGPVAARLFDRMEAGLRQAGCESWYGVVRPDNVLINRFLQRRGARAVSTATAQGLEMRYYVKRFEQPGEAAASRVTSPR